MASVKPINFTQALVSPQGKATLAFQRFLEAIGTVVNSLADLSGTSDDVTQGSLNLYLTSSEQTKLAGIEDGATADQTGAEIKAAYEGETNTNAFTDAEQTKLSGIETGATADQSDAEILTAWETETGITATDIVERDGSVAFTGPPVVPSYTVAGVPSAAVAAGIIYVSDETGGAVLAFSDGTNWRRVTDRAVVS